MAATPELLSARDHYTRQQIIANRGLKEAQRIARTKPELLAGAIATYQIASSVEAVNSFLPILAEQGIEASPVAQVVPAALAGYSSAGVPLEIIVRDLARQAAVPATMWMFERFVLTQFLDVSRQATSAMMAVTKETNGYYRQLVAPSCGRCVVLAGKFFSKNAGFQRHPRCNCRHIPSHSDLKTDWALDPVEYFNSLTKKEQAGTFTKHGAELIKAANGHRDQQYALGRVMNTRWGVRTSQAIDTKWRKQPETLVRMADGDQKLLLEMMKRYGYIR